MSSLLPTILCLLLAMATASSQQVDLVFNGFRSTENMTLDGFAKITPDGVLKLTNDTMQLGHAFFSDPVTFKNFPNSTALSFSSTFVFASVAPYANFGGHGISFVVAPSKTLVGARPSQYLGMFNESNNGNTTNHIFAVEFDNIQNTDFKDINNNHVGVDINSLTSSVSAPAGYFSSSGGFVNVSLLSGLAMQAWVDYDGPTKRISVTLAPFKVSKPSTPLLLTTIDLSPVLKETMYVGLSASTGSLPTSYCVLGWSFKNINGEAQELTLKKLPKLPRIKQDSIPWLLTVGIPILSLLLLSTIILLVVYNVRRKKKFEEVLEDWERSYGPQRYKYKDLYIATNGFKDQFLLGRGGFGRVYKGIVPTTKDEIAVKRVSHESRQGIREFVSEISSIGRLRHRNLVSLLGYCRRKDELLLVYEYMPNGSLDKYLYNQPHNTLTWTTRYRILKGVAAGLLYLHEGWEQVVLHRDIKASNVLLDGEFNGRLGDFGLARLYDHGTDPQTTHVVGTLGYLAPEHTRTGKSTKSTDVFAFGAFLLEVVTGRRPIELRGTEDVILVDWVFSFWGRGEILAARDPNLGGDFIGEEVELVLKLGLLCSQWEPTVRPTMRQVVQYLEGDKAMKEMSSDLEICRKGKKYGHGEGFDDFIMSYSSSTSMEKPYLTMSSIAESQLSCGR